MLYTFVARCCLLSGLFLWGTLAHGHSLVFAFAGDEPPVSFVEHEHVSGTLPMTARLIFDLVPDLELELVPAPWPRAQRMVQAGSADGFVTYPSEDRLEYARFTEHAAYFIDYGYLVYRRDHPKRAQLEAAESFDDLRGLQFIGQVGAEWERDNIPGFLDTVMANSLDAMIHLLMRRQAGDFVIMPPEQATYLARQYGYRSDMTYRKVGFIPNAAIPFHIGIGNDVENLEQVLQTLDEVLASREFLTKRHQLLEEYRN